MTGALGWRAGEYGKTVASDAVVEFQLWLRIELNSILEFESPPSVELRPRFAPYQGRSTPFSLWATRRIVDSQGK
jgi:hypothetical protein